MLIYRSFDALIYSKIPYLIACDISRERNPVCGRYANHVTAMQQWSEILRDWPAGIPTGYNISPGQIVPVVVGTVTMPMKWGLVPAWVKEAKLKYSTFNARVESAPQKPAFRQAWRRGQSCLVPALGFYEWRNEVSGKQPYFVCSSQGLPLVFAGLWDSGAGQSSFTILTQAANDSLSALHHRMPFILDTVYAQRWLEGDLKSVVEEQDFGPVNDLYYYPVSKEANNARNEGAQLIAPLDC